MTATISLPSSDPSFAEFTRVFTRIGFVSFGGPAGQIALMHRELVDDRPWVEESAFLRALNFCHLLPGPEAQQLATYIGWRMFGVTGGLVAGTLFIVPGALVMLALSLIYVLASGVAGFDAALAGVKAAVLAIVLQAVIRIGKRALTSPLKRVLAIGAFVALFVFNAPFPLVIALAAVIGAVAGRGEGHDAPAPVGAPESVSRLMGRSLLSIAKGGVLWAAPVVLVLVTLGQDHVLFTIAAFFSKLAVVTFGGAYAVLSYMAQEAVQQYGWLSTGQMADGLGLAETTPGPLILVTQFVGFLAAYGAPQPFGPVLAGVLGAVMTTWVTFVPCFIWIFAFAPWIERLEHARVLHSALSALTAAVVGVIANLGVWFALHVLFRRVETLIAPPVRMQVPDLSSFDVVAAGLAVLAVVLLFGWKRGPLSVLGIVVVASVVLRVMGLG